MCGRKGGNRDFRLGRFVGLEASWSGALLFRVSTVGEFRGTVFPCVRGVFLGDVWFSCSVSGKAILQIESSVALEVEGSTAVELASRLGSDCTVFKVVADEVATSGGVDTVFGVLDTGVALMPDTHGGRTSYASSNFARSSFALW